MGDNVGPATEGLLTGLTHKVLPVPGQTLHTLEVLREDDLGVQETSSSSLGSSRHGL